MNYKISKKGFTLMELLVTVILVAVLASYAVYQYTSIMDEGRVKAAKGKLGALGGATARFLMENAQSLECTYSTGNVIEADLNNSSIDRACNTTVDQEPYLFQVFNCGYAEKSLGRDKYFNFYFGCPAQNGCGTSVNTLTVYMEPKTQYASNSNFPACAYFDAELDKVVEG